MGQKLTIGPFTKGFRTEIEPFYIDNDSFPVLCNAHEFRGKIRRKRGNTFLTRPQTYVSVASVAFSSQGTINLYSLGIIPTGSQIVAGTLRVTYVSGMTINLYTDTPKDGTLLKNGNPFPSGSINYFAGEITIPDIISASAKVEISYFACLPIMGLRDFLDPDQQAPNTIIFDTKYAYNIRNSQQPYISNNISFYKNPSTSGGYTQKTTSTSLNWNGDEKNLFWTCNFAGAMWATNGVPGMQMQAAVAYSAGPPAVGILRVNSTTVTIDINGTTPAVAGDWIFINEVGISGGGSSAITDTLNFQTGYVTSSISNQLTVVFPNANISDPAPNNFTGGVVQYLTTRSNTAIDGIRWFDGDMLSGTLPFPTTAPGKGWVNYAPPLSRFAFSIDSKPTAQYYLVGAKIIYPFRDFLLFVGPYIQTSTSAIAGTPAIYLQDTIIFSQNGSPYYTASFSQSTPVYGPKNTYTPYLVPANQTAYPMALWEDVTGFGGYISSGVSQPIKTLVPNEDVLILGYPNAFTRLIYTGNNLIPFLFYRINTEYGANSTFSAITFDQGSFTLGYYGIVMCSQVSAKRVDTPILDQVFTIDYTDGANDQITAGRDYVSEMIYISYIPEDSRSIFPSQTLCYNYREETWSIINETTTCYGYFTAIEGSTWSNTVETWASLNRPWNFDVAEVLTPSLIAGNAQGFVFIKDTKDTSECISGYIESVTNEIVTSPNHCLNDLDPLSSSFNYIIISNVLDTMSTEMNGKIFRVSPIDNDNFKLIDSDYNVVSFTGYYGGLGVFTRVYVPFIQSKQFPLAWSNERKTRVSYILLLLSRTAKSRITLNYYASTDTSTIVNQNNSGQIYSGTIYTCPESTNLGLTQPNVDLLQFNQVDTLGNNFNSQAKIWHRNQCFITGDTVQFAITLSNEQVFDLEAQNYDAEIELHSIVFDVSPGALLT